MPRTVDFLNYRSHALTVKSAGTKLWSLEFPIRDAQDSL